MGPWRPTIKMRKNENSARKTRKTVFQLRWINQVSVNVIQKDGLNFNRKSPHVKPGLKAN
jgi:hypothetical protein